MKEFKTAKEAREYLLTLDRPAINAKRARVAVKKKRDKSIKKLIAEQEGAKRRKSAKRLYDAQAKEQLKLAEREVAYNQKKTNLAKLKLKNQKQRLNKLHKVMDGKEPLVTGEFKDTLSDALANELDKKDVIFEPNPGPQTEFLASSEKEVFYGGARGGGKSYAMLVDCLRYCEHRTHQALLLRRTMPELRELIDKSKFLYPKAFPKAKWREQEKEWVFPSGAKIEFGYAENLTDALRYQGRSYTWIGVDELPQYPNPDVWDFLRSCLRSVDEENVPTYMRATGNPGNVGSNWIKEMFINPAPWGEAFKVEVVTPLGKRYITRRFIPAKLSDNPYLTQSDDYLITLSSLPTTKRKQFLEGDWDVIENSAFPEFDKHIHACQPFEVPSGWRRFRSCDWGYSSPACCLWFAADYDNNLWVYRELYINGNTGRKLTADKFAQLVMALEMNDPKPMIGILDSSCWAKRGDVGPSIAETMIREGCSWRPSDRSPGSRHAGKLEIHRRLSTNIIGNGDLISEEPSLRIFSNCVNLLRTLPALPLDDNDPEDIDTDAEDHAYDALRYGCMSRPVRSIRQFNLSLMRKNYGYKPIDKTFGY